MEMHKTQDWNASERHHRMLSDQARYLAILLKDEFGVPFRFYDVDTGIQVREPEIELLSVPNDSKILPPPRNLEPMVLKQVKDDSRGYVFAQARGFLVAFMCYNGGSPILVAAGHFPSPARSSAEIQREQTLIEKWVFAFREKLRLSDLVSISSRNERTPIPQPSTANILPWETLLSLDAVARKLRVNASFERNVRYLLEAAQAHLLCESLVWVPLYVDRMVAIGTCSFDEQDAGWLCSYLGKVEGTADTKPRFHGDFKQVPESNRFPGIANLMALPVHDQGLLGWVIAINKQNSAGFRRSDAALLTPFVALLESTFKNHKRFQEQRDLVLGVTRSLTAAIDARDPYAFGHSERVARVALEIGRELSLDAKDLNDLYLAGLLHDVGNLAIREGVSRKAGGLTNEEMDHIRQHAVLGYEILADLRSLRQMMEAILHHHERWDGGGYPERRKGEDIPLLARILAVADGYDAMTSHRPHRAAMTFEVAEEQLRAGAATQWDPRAVEALLRVRDRVRAIREKGANDALRLAIDSSLRHAADTESVQVTI